MEAYRYLSILGEGSYGAVWACRELNTGRVVAIKGFKQAHEDPTVMRLAMREAKVLRGLSHPNLVQLLNAFKSKSGRVYMVFELAGRCLNSQLDRFPVGLPSALTKTVAWQLLHAVAYLHENKILHRDIKPANVLLGDDGVVKLCDFGFARHTRCGPREAAHGTSYVVTRWYRAPEILVSDLYGPAVDVWAVGCTLAEIATGRPLFPGGSSADQLWRIMRCLGPLPPQQAACLAAQERLCERTGPTPRLHKGLRQRLLELDAPLFRLLEACLQLDPRQRPTARELLQLPYFAELHLLLPPPLAAAATLAAPAPKAAGRRAVLPEAAPCRPQLPAAGDPQAAASNRPSRPVGSSAAGSGEQRQPAAREQQQPGPSGSPQAGRRSAPLAHTDQQCSHSSPAELLSPPTASRTSGNGGDGRGWGGRAAMAYDASRAAASQPRRCPAANSHAANADAAPAPAPRPCGSPSSAPPLFKVPSRPRNAATCTGSTTIPEPAAHRAPNPRAAISASGTTLAASALAASSLRSAPAPAASSLLLPQRSRGLRLASAGSSSLGAAWGEASTPGGAPSLRAQPGAALPHVRPAGDAGVSPHCSGLASTTQCSQDLSGVAVDWASWPLRSSAAAPGESGRTLLSPLALVGDVYGLASAACAASDGGAHSAPLTAPGTADRTAFGTLVSGAAARLLAARPFGRGGRTPKAGAPADVQAVGLQARLASASSGARSGRVSVEDMVLPPLISATGMLAGGRRMSRLGYQVSRTTSSTLQGQLWEQQVEQQQQQQQQQQQRVSEESLTSAPWRQESAALAAEGATRGVAGDASSPDRLQKPTTARPVWRALARRVAKMMKLAAGKLRPGN